MRFAESSSRSVKKKQNGKSFQNIPNYLSKILKKFLYRLNGIEANVLMNNAAPMIISKIIVW